MALANSLKSSRMTEVVPLKGTRFTMKFLKNTDLRRRGRARRKGAALVEFALIVTLFLLILVGMLQFGVYLNATSTLWNLSREGARFAAVQKPTNATSNAAIEQKIKDSAPPQIDVTKLTVDIQPALPAARLSGTPVTVTLTYDMKSKKFAPTPLSDTYVTTSTMKVE